MVTNKILEFVFSAPSNITVLRVLNERNIGISGREVSRLTGLSVRAVQVSLTNLGKTGIVKIAEGKREHLFTIDREKYLVKELIEKIFNAEYDYSMQILKLIRTKLKPYTVSLIQFGSTARGNETPASDFDLCIVYAGKLKVIEEIVSKLRSELYILFNITLAPIYISAAKFRQLGKQERPPVNSIIKEGKIIAGKLIKELLNG